MNDVHLESYSGVAQEAAHSCGEEMETGASCEMAWSPRCPRGSLLAGQGVAGRWREGLAGEGQGVESARGSE